MNDQPGQRIEPYSFINQHHESINIEDLRGTFWIASFIFTNCETVCPPMMYENASLQNVFAKEQVQIQFVSFSVDPEIDTPEVLDDYVKQFTDDDSNWHLLTGVTQKEIETFAREQFHTIVQKPEASNQVIHSTNFYLVDDQGYIINEYNYIDDSYQEKILQDIKKYSR